MSDGPYQATDSAELRRQIMSSTVPKNEREHWAARTIEKLERELSEQRASDVARIASLEKDLWRAIEDSKAKDAELAELRHNKVVADICRKFVQDQQISCAECVNQSDRVIVNAYEFIESICNEVGYYKEPSE